MTQEMNLLRNNLSDSLNILSSLFSGAGKENAGTRRLENQILNAEDSRERTSDVEEATFIWKKSKIKKNYILIEL